MSTKSELKRALSRKTMNKNNNNNYVLCIIYINIALYATCFQIQRPLEPFLVDKLMQGASSDPRQEYAKLQSFFSLVQTFGSIVAGRMIDHFGVKGGFIINFIGCALCYGLLSQATTLNVLYLSKVPSIFQAGFLCAQVAVTQLTNDGPERVQALGRLTTSYTVGSVIGPAFGGVLGSSGDYYFGAKLATIGSVVSLILTFFLPNNLTERKILNESGKSLDGGDSKPNIIPSFWSVIAIVWALLSTKVITSVANSMAASAFPLVLKDQYEVDEKGLGFIMSVSSVINGVFSGFVLEPTTIWLGGNLCLVISNCLIAMTVLSGIQCVVSLDSFAALSPGQGMYYFVGMAYLISIFQYALATIITSESTTRVGPNAKGTLLGLEHALFAAARVVSPQLGIYVLQNSGISTVCAVCAGIFAAVSMFWSMFGYSLTPEQSTFEKKIEKEI